MSADTAYGGEWQGGTTSAREEGRRKGYADLATRPPQSLPRNYLLGATERLRLVEGKAARDVPEEVLSHSFFSNERPVWPM